MPHTWSPPGPFRVGDRVKITSRLRPIVGEILENRGLIGHDRVHYYTVRLPIGDPDDRMIVEYPADEMVLATAEDIEKYTSL